MFRRRLIWNGTPKAPIVDGVPLVANVGDIAYKATDGSIKVVNPDKWSSALGTPVGVVVIPSGFAPDNGLARITSLQVLDYTCWSYFYENVSGITNYFILPTTDNNGSAGTGYNGYLPSDKFSSIIKSYDDPLANYSGSTPYIPSPYLGEKPNPAYYAEILGGNALSDFNGKGNTDKLYASGSLYPAAISARNYKVTGAEDIEWYLPAAGELGYLLSRFNKVASSILKAGGSQLNSYGFWSSTENSDTYAYIVDFYYGKVNKYNKGYSDYYVYPFAQLDF